MAAELDDDIEAALSKMTRVDCRDTVRRFLLEKGYEDADVCISSRDFIKAGCEAPDWGALPGQVDAFFLALNRIRTRVVGLRPARPAWNKRAFVVCCNNGNLARVRELTSPEHMAAHRGVDLNWMMDDRATALYLACFEGHIEVVRYLTSPAMLAAGIDVNKADSDGSPPLAAAAWLDRVEVARHLLESPDLPAAGITVDVNAGAEDGQTALRRACVWRASPEVVSLLLRQPQLDIDARGKGGLTALQLAEANTRPGEHGAEKAALIREAMRLPMARRYVLVVTMWSRREGRAAAPALPGGTLDEEDEEARGRRRVMGGLPRFMLEAVCRLAWM